MQRRSRILCWILTAALTAAVFPVMGNVALADFGSGRREKIDISVSREYPGDRHVARERKKAVDGTRRVAGGTMRRLTPHRLDRPAVGRQSLGPCLARVYAPERSLGLQELCGALRRISSS